MLQVSERNFKKINKHSFFKTVISNLAYLVMLLPGLVLLVLLSYLPMVGLLITFKDFKFLGKSFIESFILSDWIGLENFKFFINTPDAFIITRNVVLYNLVFIFIGNIAAMLLAIALNELRSKTMAKFHQSAMLLPYFLSWVVVSYLFFAFLSVDKGVLNKAILEPLGIAPVEWYNEVLYWPFIIVFAHMFKYAGYNSIIYLASIAGLDIELYEAAVLDGASKWQQMRKITIPLLSPVFIILILFGVGRIFNADFGLFYQVPLNSGALYNATNVIDTYVYNALRGAGDIGMSSAAGLYQSIVGFILVITVNSIVKRIDAEKSLF